MSATVSEHYARILAPIYAWMVGDFDAACDASSRLFDELGVQPTTTGRAIDLGCGHGVQAVPLARRGFDVIAVDSSELLLQELSRRAGRLRVTPVHDDLQNAACHVTTPVDVVACMGDTLTHLESFDAVWRVIDTAAAMLAPAGRLVLSFRDYTADELRGDERFIHVRSDEARIHTCFLECRPEVIQVHDIVHSRSDGRWTMAVGSYPKLRLSAAAVLERAVANGLTLSHRLLRGGMLYLCFARRRVACRFSAV